MTANSASTDNAPIIFADTIDRIRLFGEVSQAGEEPGWVLDGHDWMTGRFTELVWRFATHEEARTAQPFFIDALRDAGIAGTENHGFSDGLLLPGVDWRPGSPERTDKKVLITIV